MESPTLRGRGPNLVDSHYYRDFFRFVNISTRRGSDHVRVFRSQRWFGGLPATYIAPPQSSIDNSIQATDFPLHFSRRTTARWRTRAMGQLRLSRNHSTSSGYRSTR